jgi:hypothetical protein
MPIGRVYQAPPIQPLNAGLDWNQLGPDHRDAFRGVGQKVKLEARFRLYKFTAWDITNRAGKVTEWWSPLEPYQWDPGLRARLNLAEHLGGDAADLTRVMCAVRTNWNALTHVLTATLLKPVYGFWGQVGWQPRDGDEKVGNVRILDRAGGLPGFASQFYIPNLKLGEHIKQDKKEPVADVMAGRKPVF